MYAVILATACCDERLELHSYFLIHIHWDTCSQCEQRLIKAYSFTMKTLNGVNVGLDYRQQKCLGLVRGGTGKIKRHGSKGKIELNSFVGWANSKRRESRIWRACNLYILILLQIPRLGVHTLSGFEMQEAAGSVNRHENSSKGDQ